MSRMQSLWDRLPHVKHGSDTLPTAPVAGTGSAGKFIFIPCYITGITPYYDNEGSLHQREVLVPNAISAVQRDSVWLVASGRGVVEKAFLLPNGQPYEANPDVIEGIIDGKITEIMIDDNTKWLFGYKPTPSDTVVNLSATAALILKG